jgi:hypothetical protein
MEKNSMPPAFHQQQQQQQQPGTFPAQPQTFVVLGQRQRPYPQSHGCCPAIDSATDPPGTQEAKSWAIAAIVAEVFVVTFAGYWFLLFVFGIFVISINSAVSCCNRTLQLWRLQSVSNMVIAVYHLIMGIWGAVYFSFDSYFAYGWIVQFIAAPILLVAGIHGSRVVKGYDSLPPQQVAVTIPPASASPVIVQGQVLQGQVVYAAQPASTLPPAYAVQYAQPAAYSAAEYSR